jgi:hypothetical protein
MMTGMSPCRGPDLQVACSSVQHGEQSPVASHDASAPCQPVTTRIPLPPLAWGSPVLTLTGEWPPCITAGAPFPLRLTAVNNSPHLMELGINLGDTTGFVLAGAHFRSDLSIDKDFMP